MATPSFYQKGGFPNETRWVFYTILTFLAIDELLIYGKIHWLESALITLIFSGISLFLTVFVVGAGIVEGLYGDRTWHLWEDQNRILVNSLMALANTGIFLLLVSGYRFARKEIALATKK